MASVDDIRRVESFLYEEAAMLDEWRLQEWLDLLTDDAEYEIPATDSPDADCRDHLALVFADRAQIEARVDHLLNGYVCAEEPRSRVRRMISNVRILEKQSDCFLVSANFVLYRFHNQRMDTFVGRYLHTLVPRDSGFGIKKRRVVLDLDVLRPHGKLSIIL